MLKLVENIIDNTLYTKKNNQVAPESSFPFEYCPFIAESVATMIACLGSSSSNKMGALTPSVFQAFIL